MADINADDHLDIVVKIEHLRQVSIYLGNGNQTFAPTAISLGGDPWGVATSDFNGDGVQDIVITLSSNNELVRILSTPQSAD